MILMMYHLQPQFSTPVVDTAQQLCDFISELGSQIGESIASRLLASQSPLTSPPVPSSKQATKEISTIDLSKLNLVVKSDIKEPPVFRGDGEDKYSVQEWIDMMEIYMTKKNLSAHEQKDELLNRLLGKAKAL